MEDRKVANTSNTCKWFSAIYYLNNSNQVLKEENNKGIRFYGVNVYVCWEKVLETENSNIEESMSS